MKEKKSSIGCLFWIALILLILVIFLFNRTRIQTVLENTGFLDVIANEEVEPDVERIEDNASDENNERPIQVQEENINSENSNPVAQVNDIEESVEIVTPVQEPNDETQNDPIILENETRTDPQLRKSRLYFVKVESDGNINLKGIMRPIYYTDSPLTETLTNLLKGLSTTEINEGLLSLIPEGTSLISAAVRGKTAYLNFNDNFLFNAWGVEGYTAQLEQVVFTALEFSTVDNVQILINGEKKNYMGIEGGPYIGEPLTRDSF